MTSQTERFLRTEELYDEVTCLITEDTMDDVGGVGHVRGLLDAILSQGKIEGRLSALPDRVPGGGETWRLQTDHRQSVYVHGVSRAQLVVYRDPHCPCINEEHGISGHQNSTTIQMFTEMYEPVDGSPDRMIEGWQRIVDSV
mgnify:CR=1 FL=1